MNNLTHDRPTILRSGTYKAACYRQTVNLRKAENGQETWRSA